VLSQDFTGKAAGAVATTLSPKAGVEAETPEEEDFARAMSSRLFNANYNLARLKSILSRLKMLYIMT
jgi:hypothetical protein